MAPRTPPKNRPAALASAPLHRRGATRILSLLTDAERERVSARCARVSVRLEDTLHRAGERMAHVYFPLSGMISMIIGSAEGTAIEIGTVGNEGLLGAGVALGAERSHWRSVVQVEGEVLRLRVPDFREALGRDGALADLSRRYAQALTFQIAQSVMCNGLHSVEQRFSRWLLMAHDRAGVDRMHMTQEFIANMLGVHRSTVTVAAGMLQKDGLIGYSHGTIEVLDRTGLENTSCECYRLADRELRALLQSPDPL